MDIEIKTPKILYMGFYKNKNGNITITYKGKKVQGDWITGNYVRATHHWHKYGQHRDYIITDAIQNGGWFNVRGRFPVLDGTVRSYLRKTDINGKRIYGGDIVKDEYGNVGAFFFSEERLAWGLAFYKKDNDLTGYLYAQYDDPKFEIIGNVWETPELIKENKQ